MTSTAINAVLALDAAISLPLGLILFFAPSAVGHFVFGRATDGVHWHLIRCVGGQILAGSVFFYRFRQRSPETRSACLVLRVVSCIFGLLLLFHSRSVTPQMVNPELLKTLIYGNFAIIALYMALLVFSGWPIGDFLHKDSPMGNFLYQLDSIASIAIGMAWMTCPHWLLHRQVKVQMDATHEFCGRMMGSLFVASHIISTHALHWRSQENRSLAAEARALCCVFILSAQLWSQIAYDEHWSGKHWVGISLFSTWTVISVVYRICIWLTLFPEKPKPKLK
jgi:hypothetical protein